MAKQTGIRKLPNGRFRARFFAGYDSKGKRKYPARTFDTQSEAVKWRAEQVSAKNPGRCFEGRGQTVSQFLDRWLVMKKQTLRANSWQMYQLYLDTYVKPALGHIRLTRLSPMHVEAMQAELLTRVSGATAASARTLLFGALKKARRLGLIPVNPVEGTDGPSRGKPERYPLTVEEGLRLSGACEGSRFGLLIKLALESGLRPEELIGLQWPCLELGSRGVVRVRRVILHLRGGGWTWDLPKTKNSIRSVVLSGELPARLAEHRKTQLEQKLRAGQYWRAHDLVFTTSLGGPVRPDKLRKEFKAVLARAGLPAIIRLYDCRHFFVTSSLLAGISPKVVSEEAGHGSVAFTLDHYGSVLEEQHETAADKRQELMKSRAIK